MMKRKVWIFGPVAIDRVLYIGDFLTQGTFTRPKKIVQRIGGSSGNVALALSSTGAETGFVSYVGHDEAGLIIKEHFESSQIKHLYLKKLPVETNQTIVIVDESGERTIVAMTDSHLDAISMEDLPIAADDICVFSLWRPFFLELLLEAQQIGCQTVVGLEALADEALPFADWAIGSENELNDTCPANSLHRFPSIVVTRGKDGVDLYTSQGIKRYEPPPTELIDATGAGDSFLAGFLSVFAREANAVDDAIHFGLAWAAATCAVEGSIPVAPPTITIR